MLIKITQLGLGCILLIHHAFAFNLKHIGTVEQAIYLTQANTESLITLPEYELSKQAQDSITQDIKHALKSHATSNNILYATTTPQKKQLGMNDVPVLDQGRHGTCATFATTAAIDALIHQGNYISQLCLLQLGNHLGETGQGQSSWDGGSSRLAFERMNQYGIINLENQRKYGCAGVKNYPYWTPSKAAMSAQAYAEHSEGASGKLFTWKLLFNKFSPHASNDIATIKDALNAGHRIVFSTLLPRTDLGTMGAVAWHTFYNDTWVLTHDISEEIEYQTKHPGHTMIITGFDDEAIAMDTHGHRHRGLLTLRNSWGPFVADWGNFYMSYDYFNALATQGYQIQPPPMKT